MIPKSWQRKSHPGTLHELQSLQWKTAAQHTSSLSSKMFFAPLQPFVRLCFYGFLYTVFNLVYENTKEVASFFQEYLFRQPVNCKKKTPHTYLFAQTFIEILA